MEVAKAIENYKRLADFKDEVGEAACNAFEKGFEGCKRKIFKVFNLLDLSEIFVNEPTPLPKSIEAERSILKSARESQVRRW